MKFPHLFHHYVNFECKDCKAHMTHREWKAGVKTRYLGWPDAVKDRRARFKRLRLPRIAFLAVSVAAVTYVGGIEAAFYNIITIMVLLAWGED